MKSLLICPKKRDSKRPVKKTTARKATGLNIARGILNNRRNNCSRFMLYPDKPVFKTNNKFVSNKDKFSLWQK